MANPNKLIAARIYELWSDPDFIYNMNLALDIAHRLHHKLENSNRFELESDPDFLLALDIAHTLHNILEKFKLSETF